MNAMMEAAPGYDARQNNGDVYAASCLRRAGDYPQDWLAVLAPN